MQVPSIVEGFLSRWRGWIQEDEVVREVCHAHLLRLTRLRLLAPMQTQHCLKILNGTCTPCPDYMFDHLRPAGFVAQQMKKNAAVLPSKRRAPSVAPNAAPTRIHTPVNGKPLPPGVRQALLKGTGAVQVPQSQYIHSGQGYRDEGVAYHNVDKQNARSRGNRANMSVAQELPDGRHYAHPTPNKEAIARMVKHHLADNASPSRA
jgi:hypothetical protein